MHFFTLDAPDYETALKEARTQYGTSVRVHTRKDYVIRKSFVKKRRCTISFYLVEEKDKEAEIPESPVVLSNPEKVASFPQDWDGQKAVMTALLEENDFSEAYQRQCITTLLPEGVVFERADELEMALLEHLVQTTIIDYNLNSLSKQFFVMVGPTGVGKTTTLVKMALFYLQSRASASQNNTVALLSLDSYRTGATNQIEQFAQDFGLELFHAHSEEELSDLLPILRSYPLVLVDTMGKSETQGELSLHLKSLLSVLPQEECSYSLAVSASHKGRDLERFVTQFSSYPLSSFIVTKLDETLAIGNVLSVSTLRALPMLFFTNGQKVPDNLVKASNAVILSYMRGFTLDLQSLDLQLNQSGK